MIGDLSTYFSSLVNPAPVDSSVDAAGNTWADATPGTAAAVTGGDPILAGRNLESGVSQYFSSLMDPIQAGEKQYQAAKAQINQNYAAQQTVDKNRMYAFIAIGVGALLIMGGGAARRRGY